MPQMKSTGVTPTEQFLTMLCERSFLRLWSYANPYKDDGHEFCDVLAVFGNHVFVFFDRQKKLANFVRGVDPHVRWERWKRGVIDRQIDTLQGAERYLRSGRKIYLDAKRKKEFPVPINVNEMVFHKILVAHGASEACKNFSSDNIYGSLAICYGELDSSSSPPFMICLSNKSPVHVFDSHNLPIIFEELDTVKDFSDYLDAKEYAISTLSVLSYCGEEDLLGHYFRNFDPLSKRHFIGITDKECNGLAIGEGEWRDTLILPQYIETKKVNKTSYFWDKIIQRTCDNWLSGKLLGDGQLLSDRGAVQEMAKEPRFMRRAIVEQMFKAISAFPDKPKSLVRHMSFFRSYYSRTAYVFLQLWVPPDLRGEDASYRAKRQEILRIACGAAKNRYPDLDVVVGICIPPPNLEENIGEDFLWMDCHNWTDKLRAEYDELNIAFNFFKTGLQYERTVSEFVSPPRILVKSTKEIKKKIGRNELCPCGSGRKFKKCHGP